MSILIKIICPVGIITATDTREVYSRVDVNNEQKIIINHYDGVSKTYKKGKYVISICGNAYIDDAQIKDLFPNFLENFDEHIELNQLADEILNLYKKLDKSFSTKYYISFFDKTPPNSKYFNFHKQEPCLYMVDSKDEAVKRLNIDDDGFTYGIFWGGVTDKIEEVLKEKRKHINTNQFTIESSLDFITKVIQDVQNIFKNRNEYSTVGGEIDLYIQTKNGIDIKKLH
jgi:hypothetical protein